MSTALLVLVGGMAWVVPGPTEGADGSTCFGFGNSAEGFAKGNDQPYSDLAWDDANGRIRLLSDRRDGSDEQLAKAGLALSDVDSFSVTAEWSVVQQGNWQGAVPLFLSAPGATHFFSGAGYSGAANVMFIDYSARDSNLGEPPAYSVVYRDGTGTIRLNPAPVRAPVSGVYKLSIGYDAPVRHLTMEVATSSGSTVVAGSYTIGTSPGDGFAMEVVGVASRGIPQWEEPVTRGWTDNICIGPDAGPNAGPVAAIAPVPVQECMDRGAMVTLDGSGSRDPDGDPLTYAWSAPGVVWQGTSASTARPTGRFPLGTTVVTLTVTDTAGATASATAPVTVQDTLPPTLALTRPVASTLYVQDYPLLNSHDPRVQYDIIAIGPLTIEAAAQDQCTDVAVTFASGLGPTATDAAPPFQFLSNPGPLEVGEVTVTAVAEDDSGLRSAPTAATFQQLGTLVLPSSI